MSSDSTRLFIYNQAAEYYEDSNVSPQIDDKEISVVEKILKNSNFHVSETSYDSTIISNIFVTTDKNLNRVDTVEEELKDNYPEREIDRSKHYSDQAPSSEGLPYVIGITIKSTEKEKEVSREKSQELQEHLEEKKKTSAAKENDWKRGKYGTNESDSSPEWRAFDSESSSQRECPECGGETAHHGNGDETVCTECGFVLEDADHNVKESVGVTTELELDVEHSDDDSTPPETVAEWKMWYPCPACGSIRLDQIVEQHLSVSATKDGVYGGEDSMEEYNYIECSSCGEVLLDEIGKS